ncbi:uncharacterized protein BJ171DRAFT_641739 [Polychytrium aggregatum]|uniref:uncharacterized protein n=1 Tax=Polychytrium aggregatum TaxID=110093 RepID=UPI0022FF14B7|nr:uncharacterized protein BJ171DRAFT_641739 [Polychytrium aggregatum]KAI9206905.1 hypothetical protein BJ171DRAFT_641739 [Polychytrium aggregatum]
MAEQAHHVSFAHGILSPLQQSPAMIIEVDKVTTDFACSAVLSSLCVPISAVRYIGSCGLDADSRVFGNPRFVVISEDVVVISTLISRLDAFHIIQLDRITNVKPVRMHLSGGFQSAETQTVTVRLAVDNWNFFRVLERAIVAARIRVLLKAPTVHRPNDYAEYLKLEEQLAGIHLGRKGTSDRKRPGPEPLQEMCELVTCLTRLCDASAEAKRAFWQSDRGLRFIMRMIERFLCQIYDFAKALRKHSQDWVLASGWCLESEDFQKIHGTIRVVRKMVHLLAIIFRDSETIEESQIYLKRLGSKGSADLLNAWLSAYGLHIPLTSDRVAKHATSYTTELLGPRRQQRLTAEKLDIFDVFWSVHKMKIRIVGLVFNYWMLVRCHPSHLGEFNRTLAKYHTVVEAGGLVDVAISLAFSLRQIRSVKSLALDRVGSMAISPARFICAVYEAALLLEHVLDLLPESCTRIRELYADDWMVTGFKHGGEWLPASDVVSDAGIWTELCGKLRSIGMYFRL